MRVKRHFWCFKLTISDIEQKTCALAVEQEFVYPGIYLKAGHETCKCNMLKNGNSQKILQPKFVYSGIYHRETLTGHETCNICNTTIATLCVR